MAGLFDDLIPAGSPAVAADPGAPSAPAGGIFDDLVPRFPQGQTVAQMFPSYSPVPYGVRRAGGPFRDILAPYIGETATNLLGRTLRIGAEGAADFAGIVANPLNVIVRRTTGAEVPNDLRGATSRLLNEAGVPGPESTLERVADAGGSLAASGMTGVATGAARGVPALAREFLSVAPATQAAAPAAGGMVTQGLVEGGADPLVAGAAGLATSLIGGVGMGMRELRPPSPAASRFMDTLSRIRGDMPRIFERNRPMSDADTGVIPVPEGVGAASPAGPVGERMPDGRIEPSMPRIGPDRPEASTIPEQPRVVTVDLTQQVPGAGTAAGGTVEAPLPAPGVAYGDLPVSTPQTTRPPRQRPPEAPPRTAMEIALEAAQQRARERVGRDYAARTPQTQEERLAQMNAQAKDAAFAQAEAEAAMVRELEMGRLQREGQLTKEPIPGGEPTPPRPNSESWPDTFNYPALRYPGREAPPAAPVDAPTPARPEAAVPPARASVAYQEHPTFARFPPEQQQRIVALVDQAEAVKPRFDAVIEDVATAIGGQAKTAPLKGAERALAKSLSDYDGVPLTADGKQRLRDIVRATIAVERPEQAVDAVQRLRGRYFILDDSRNLLDPNAPPPIDGYRDAKLSVVVDGHIAEVQINHPLMLAAKQEAHPLFVERSALEREVKALASELKDVPRGLQERIESLNAQMRAIYEPVWARINAANRSSEMGAPLRRADSGSNTRGGAVSQAAEYGTSLPANLLPKPSVTGMPSTLKNSVPGENSGSSIASTSRPIIPPPPPAPKSDAAATFKREAPAPKKQQAAQPLPRSMSDPLADVLGSHGGDRAAARKALVQAIDEDANGGAKVWRPVLDELDAMDAAPAAAAQVDRKPAAVVQHVEPGGKPEPATAPVVKEALTEGGNLRAARDSALKQVERLIAQARSMHDFTLDKDGFSLAYQPSRTAGDRLWVTLKSTDPKKPEPVQKLAEVDPEVLAKTVGYVRIEIPGDGAFRIVNTQEHLKAFFDKLRRAGGFSQAPAPRPNKGGVGSAGASTDESIKEMLKANEYLAAHELAKLSGRRWGYGRTDKHPNLYIEVEDANLGKGVDAFVGRLAFAGRGQGMWYVIERNTGLSIAEGTTKQKALNAATGKALDKIGAAIKTHGKVPQEKLEADWLKWAEANDVGADKPGTPGATSSAFGVGEVGQATRALADSYRRYVGEPAYQLLQRNPGSSLSAALGFSAGYGSADEDAPALEKIGRGLAGAALGFAGAKGIGRIPTKDGRVSDTAGRWFIDNYGLRPEYVQMRKAMGAHQNSIADQFLTIAREAAALPREQRRLLYNILQGEAPRQADLAALNDRARAAITELGQRMVDYGMLAKETFEKNAATYLHRSYTSKLPGTQPSGVTRAVKMIGSELKPRGVLKDVAAGEVERFKAAGWEEFGRAQPGAKTRTMRWQLTKEQRQQLGEIEDAAYAIAETGRLMSRDVSAFKFFDDVAKRFASDVEQPGYLQVSTDKIPKTAMAKFGNLAGKWLPEDIHSDITRMVAVRNFMDLPGIREYRVLNAWWKTTKTALNPVVHTNNVLSNMVLYDLSDAGWTHVARAAKEMALAKSGKNAPLWDMAKRAGVFDANMANVELAKASRELLEQYAQIRAEPRGPIRTAIDIAKTGWRQTGGRMIDLYQAEDSVFRLGVFSDRLRKGMSVEDAAAEARRWFVDYDINAPGIEVLRNTATPFIAYTYRVIPLLAEAATTRPWKFAKWALLAAGVNALGEKMGGGDTEAERAAMPERQRGELWGLPFMPPQAVKMPFQVGGTPQYLDVTRWLPGGDLTEINQDNTFVPGLPTPLQPNFGALGSVIAAGQGYDPFRGKKLEGLGLGLADDAKIKGEYLARQFLPNNPVVPGSYSWNKIADSIRGKASPLGDVLPVWQAAAQSVGVKLNPADLEKMQRRAAFDAKHDVDTLHELARQYRREFERGRLSEEEFQQRIDELRQQRDKIVEKRDRRLNRRPESGK